MRTIILTGCVLGLVGSSVAAAPVVIEANRAEMQTEQVSFADLDISGPSGLRALHSRIRAAATRVCANSNPEPLSAGLEYLGCYRGAMSDAHAQVDQILAARKSGTAIAAATISVVGR